MNNDNKQKKDCWQSKKHPIDESINNSIDNLLEAILTTQFKRKYTQKNNQYFKKVYWEGVSRQIESYQQHSK